jgi:tetratricopeptide (TPR) repeat protein
MPSWNCLRKMAGAPDYRYSSAIPRVKNKPAQKICLTRIRFGNTRALLRRWEWRLYEQAIPPLERSLKINPASSETHWTLAKAYSSHQQYDAALKQAQEALAESHGASPEIELVAQSLTAVGRYDDAAQTLRDYLKNHRKDAGAVTARKWLDRLAADGKIRRN